MRESTSAPSGTGTLSGIPECPECGLSGIDDSIPSIDPVCLDCGRVLSEGRTERPPADESVGTDSEPGWSESYAAHNSTEQQIGNALEILEEVGGQLGLSPATRVQIAELYADAAVENLTDGRPTESVVGAAAIIVGRVEGSPLLPNAVSDACGVRESGLRTLVSRLSRELGYELPTCSPEDYIAPLCGALSLNAGVEDRARKLVAQINPKALAGKHPLGFTCAALYLALDGKVAQRTIAQTAGITQETIRVRLQDFR